MICDERYAEREKYEERKRDMQKRDIDAGGGARDRIKPKTPYSDRELLQTVYSACSGYR